MRYNLLIQTKGKIAQIGEFEMPNLNDTRRKVDVVLIKKENGTRILFDNHSLSGEFGTTWFPIQSELTVFQDIEQIMVLAGVAHNVVSAEVKGQVWELPVEHGRKLIEVIYNVPVEKEYSITVRNLNIDHLVDDCNLASFRIKSGNILETLLKLDYTEHLSNTKFNITQYIKKAYYSAYDSSIFIGDNEKDYMEVEWNQCTY